MAACFTKISCSSDKAGKSELFLALPLAFHYLWLRPRLRRLGNAKENELFLGAALAFRYLCPFGTINCFCICIHAKKNWRHSVVCSTSSNTIEEVYELCDALTRSDNKNICKELGDVLLHIVFYAKIGQEKGAFDVADVCNELCDKLIFRHPHVFGNVEGVESASLVTRQWELLKQQEKDGNGSVLGGVPQALPSLIKAYRIQDKARGVGFDWEERRQVWAKVKEEIAEFEAEVEHMDKQKAEAELGDVLFSLINAARLYKINPDNALERTNQKFIRRFNYLEEHTLKQGRALTDMTLAEMDAIWEEAKRHDAD